MGDRSNWYDVGEAPARVVYSTPVNFSGPVETHIVEGSADTKVRHGDPRFYALLAELLPRFHAIVGEIADLHSDKNHDYAKDGEPLSNFNRSERVGVEPWRGVLVRMTDKWSRIEELAKGKTPKNESLRDSLIDNAVYSLIDVLLLEDAK